jgi:PAS domain S-box-containing protein
MAKNSKPQVLIVEDKDDDVILLRRKLKSSCRIEVASDGEAALQACTDFEPDLIIVDYDLLDMDGVDLLSRIRDLRPSTPVVAMMAESSKKIAGEVIKRGASECLIKPAGFKEISDHVKRALEKRELEIEKRDLEMELKKERDYLQTIVECSTDGIVMTDSSGMISFFSPGAEALFGLKETNVIGKDLACYLARGSVEMRRIIEKINEEGLIRNSGVDFLHKDESRIITFLSGSLLKDEKKNIKGILFVIRDASEEIKLEHEIYESKNELESVFDSIVDPLAVVSPEYIITRANIASAGLIKIDVKETIGKKCHRVLNGSEERCEVCPVEETYRTKANASVELRSEELGEIFAVNSYPIFDLNNNLKGVIENRKIITEQKILQDERQRLEMELMEKHKLSSIGLLVQGVAHNLNTPLGVILGRSELLKSEIDEVLGEKVIHLLEPVDNDEIKEAAGFTKEIKESADNGLDVILKQVENMSSIIGNMMYKSRQEQDSEKKKISLNQVLEEELTFLMADMYFKHEIEKKINFDQNLPYIEGVYSDFSQSFTNIIRNAIDAMFSVETKVLTVTTRHDGEFVYVIFHDTGEGVEEENRSKIFDPFFTTKEFGSPDGGPSGVGLGLHSCYQLLNPYGVRFYVESQPGDTTFTLKIPINLSELDGE